MWPHCNAASPFSGKFLDRWNHRTRHHCNLSHCACSLWEILSDNDEEDRYIAGSRKTPSVDSKRDSSIESRKTHGSSTPWWWKCQMLFVRMLFGGVIEGRGLSVILILFLNMILWKEKKDWWDSKKRAQLKDLLGRWGRTREYIILPFKRWWGRG